MPSPETLARYCHAPSDTVADATEFEDLVVEIFRACLSWPISIYRTKHEQLTIGESPQRVEVKLDNPVDRGRPRTNWVIELAEKSSRNVDVWTPAGIFREDNAALYVVGSPTRTTFVFSKGELRRWYGTNCPKWHEFNRTRRSFFLDRDLAVELALYVFEPGPWRLTPPRSVKAPPGDLLASRLRRPGQSPAVSVVAPIGYDPEFGF